LLNAIIKGPVGMKRETNNDSAIVNSLHKKKKRVTCHDVGSIRITNYFLKIWMLIKVFDLTSNHLWTTFWILSHYLWNPHVIWFCILCTVRMATERKFKLQTRSSFVIVIFATVRLGLRCAKKKWKSGTRRHRSKKQSKHKCMFVWFCLVMFKLKKSQQIA
jgi:membrane protein insertase Oxa1/YidC/SpoIIIJ